MNAHASNVLDSYPALVLNADFRPLSYYPLSLWSWQEAVKAVFLDRVNIVSEYDQAAHSPSFEMKLPSVVSLKSYVKPALYPAFTRFNVFLRDRFSCQYCYDKNELTFDHLVPRSLGGLTRWDNVVTACSPCNLAKANKMPAEVGMIPFQAPYRPTVSSSPSEFSSSLIFQRRSAPETPPPGRSAQQMRRRGSPRNVHTVCSARQPRSQPMHANQP